MIVAAADSDMQSEIRKHLSSFGQDLDQCSDLFISAETLNSLARAHMEGSISPAAVCDLLLLDVAMVQWLRMVRKWQSEDVAWTTKAKVSAAIRWYLLGQNLGQMPMYEGICAFCGTLLYGGLNTKEFGNKWSGVPINIDGKRKTSNGHDVAEHAQPPFLRRWSPAFLAEKVPDVFAWDPTTRKLQLREHHRECPPWMRPEHHRARDEDECWLYCKSCHSSLFQSATHDKPHVPFRDRHGAESANTRSTASVNSISQSAGTAASTDDLLGSRAAEATKWEEKLREHARGSNGRFSLSNLVPKPDIQRWQHAPHVPFNDLKTGAATSRLSVCKLDSCMKEGGFKDGRATYTCTRGETNFWRRNVEQIAGTLAFMMDRNEASWCEIRADEVPVLRECLRWLKQNNPHVRQYFTNAERFGIMQRKLSSLLPQGDFSTPMRVMRNKATAEAVESTIGATLNDEDAVLVILDPDQFPTSWATVDELADAVGNATLRVERDGHCEDVGPDLRQQVATTAERFRQDARVTLSDPHLDAKLFPHLHPWGSGSLRSEDGAGGIQQFAKNRLLSLDPAFRNSAVWSFWMLDRLIKNELYFQQRGRRKRAREQAGAEEQREDAVEGNVYSYLFGRVEPRNIPESGAWWKQRQGELLALSAPHELGIMSGMATLTQNDDSSELLANARRGPCAAPSDREMIEFLLLHNRSRTEARPNITKDPTAATLSFQRRAHAFKERFMKQNHPTPLGVVTDYWDRTEAQTRQALHAHIPFWAKRRKLNDATSLQTASDRGVEHRLYTDLEMARVHGELVRPMYNAEWTRADLLWSFLLRSIQTHLYIHSCSLAYCLKNRQRCRFFFPWQKQERQQYDETKERIALRRRYPPDDQWIVPHNLEAAAFSPGTINVMPFDPEYGAEQSRLYACKYCGKPEPWYYTETRTPGEAANPVKRFLQSRNIGMCMCQNRLMGFRVVRSTRPTQYTYPKFAMPATERMRLPPESQSNSYPDPQFYLNNVQKYFFRPEPLRDLRLGQFVRYFYFGDDPNGATPSSRRTDENTQRDTDHTQAPDDREHRHWHNRAYDFQPGELVRNAQPFAKTLHARRRAHSRLCVPRSAFIEPLGTRREEFYEQRLLESLPWYVPSRPEVMDNDTQRWQFQCDMPWGGQLQFAMTDRNVHDTNGMPITFEELCQKIEGDLGQVACACCADLQRLKCPTCTHCIGVHCCERAQGQKQWKAGTLHNGKMDVDNSLWSLARRNVPIDVIDKKIDEYIIAGHLRSDDKDSRMRMFEEMSNVVRVQNPNAFHWSVAFGEQSEGAPKSSVDNQRMSMEELRQELENRELAMQKAPPVEHNGHDHIPTDTDQWRVYSEIVSLLSGVQPLRVIIQASAGTGKSFLMETLYMWCLLNNHIPEACAPTGIAAARINVARTAVQAYTIHNLFQLNLQLQSKIDPSKEHDPAVERLVRMTVLFIDEISMLDDEAWAAIKDQLSSTSQRSLHQMGLSDSNHPVPDGWGRVHLILCGDYKQLPPATGRPPFIGVDHDVMRDFRFRVLRQNRRLAPACDASKQAQLDAFHSVLEDVAHNRPSEMVREHIKEAYVRGAKINAHNVDFENSTACFTKCVYRNRWNRIVLKRSAKKHDRSLKVKAIFCSATNKDRTIEGNAVNSIKRCVRSQSLIKLHLAGQWMHDQPAIHKKQPHLMRAMLVANLDVQNRFANGTRGRVASWSPEIEDPTTESIPANHPDLVVRFFHEDAIKSQKKEFLSGVDFIDITARSETVENAKGKPYMLQLQIQPSYGLTIHKIQALTLADGVLGCFEGVFAHGQIYVLWSRVTDPEKFAAVGLPPTDMLDEIARAWRDAGFDVNVCFQKASEVTQDWEYTPAAPGADATQNVAARLRSRWDHQRRVPLKLPTLDSVINPQPKTAKVLTALLKWIDDTDMATQDSTKAPTVPNTAFQSIFGQDKDWWLTEMERRKPPKPSAESEKLETAKDLTCNATLHQDDLPSDASDEVESSNSSEISESEDEDTSSPWNQPEKRMKTGREVPSKSSTTDNFARGYTRTPDVWSQHRGSNVESDLWGDRYFERQEQARCGKHAVNNVIGGPQFLEADLRTAAMQVIAETDEDSQEHVRENGWYSHSVLARALQNAIPPQWRLLLAPLATTAYENLQQHEQIYGAVVNENNAHWSAIVKHAGHLWHVDSGSRPIILDYLRFCTLLQRFPMTFAVVSATYDG